jgi:septal ring factor EnvC (AmiA/AmiB activator)
VTAQTEKDSVETNLLKQQEKVNILETQVVKAQKDRENLQSEMEMLLDRINKLSELLDKSRVRVALWRHSYQCRHRISVSHGLVGTSI